MKLVPAGGSPRMQRALSHPYVQTIVGILLQYPDLLAIVAELLQTYERRAQVGLEDALDALRINQQRSGSIGQTTPGHVTELIQTLHNLYKQPDEDIVYHRGAIVEVLVFKLISNRYNAGECVSNHSFVDEQGRVITDQVDVAALSRTKREIEGYECKLKADGIKSSDCTNLAKLATVAQHWGYHANVGVVTLDDDMYMKRKLARLQPAPVIKFYGLDTIETLRDSPFQGILGNFQG